MRPARLPIPPPLLERSPELAALAILETALAASELALLASHAELYHRGIDGLRRGSSVLRANSVIIHARRLAAVIAAYRDSLDRDARRVERDHYSTSF